MDRYDIDRSTCEIRPTLGGEYVRADDAEDTYYQARLEGFNECEQLIFEYIDLTMKEALTIAEQMSLQLLLRRLKTGAHRQPETSL